MTLATHWVTGKASVGNSTHDVNSEMPVNTGNWVDTSTFKTLYFFIYYKNIQ